MVGCACYYFAIARTTIGPPVRVDLVVVAIVKLRNMMMPAH